MFLPVLLGLSLLFGQVGALSPVPGVYIYVHDVVIGVILLSSFWQFRTAKKSNRTYGELSWPIGAFVGAAVFSILANANHLDTSVIVRSLLYIARWAYYASLYYVIARDGKPMRWLTALYWTGVGFAIIGFFQFFLFPSLRSVTYLGWDPHYYRLFATLLDPNFMGIILVLTLFLARLVYEQIPKSIYIANKIIVGLALILTFSRSSLLGLVAGFIVWATLEKRTKLLAVAALFVVVAILIPKPGGDNLSFFRKDSTLARIVNWQQSLPLIMSAPLVGHGFYALPAPGPVEPGTVSRATATLDNSLLFVFATTGIVGLVSYLWLLLASESLLESMKKKHAEVRTVGLIVLAALIVHSFFVNSLFYAWTMIWFWVFLGSAEAIGKSGTRR